MREQLSQVLTQTERFVVWLAGFGAAIILVQMVWISYGVFVRYGFGSPDKMVTEATALLLFPVAFCGLAYALFKDAYPRVTLLTDQATPAWQRRIQIINYLLMIGVGIFFSYAGVSATIRSFYSGASSEILHWPRYYFWIPGAFSLLVFTFYTILRLIRTWVEPETIGKS